MHVSRGLSDFVHVELLQEYQSTVHRGLLRLRVTSPMPAFAERSGQPKTVPVSSANTRMNCSETCSLQFSQLDMVFDTYTVLYFDPVRLFQSNELAVLRAHRSTPVASICTAALFGRASTPTRVNAGRLFSKNSSYARSTASESFMSVR